MRSDQPTVLDLFSCSGACSVGYSAAGFKVVRAVDIAPRPRYPFQDVFHQGDALEFVQENRDWIRDNVDLVHASPPCQAKCALTLGTNAHMAGRYVDLYPPTRDLLYDLGVPATIENPDARPDVVLCGEMFGLGVLRHRNIELVGWSAPKPKHVKHRGYVRGWRHGEYHDGPYIAAYGDGGGKATVPEMQAAMGIPWTDVREELTEALPPAYARWVGEQFLAQSA
jgi:DNA (cytosine-5)-methyltransferase 1